MMRDKILSCMLVFPMVTHWLLPVHLEDALYLKILGFPIYLPAFTYLIYINAYNKLNTEGVAITSKLQNIIKASIVLFSFYCITLGLFRNQDDIIYRILGDQMFLFSAFIFLIYPMSERMIEDTKYIIIPASIVIILEVFLYGLGILQMETDTSFHEYGGISRISTTIAASTGTAVILSILGAIISNYKINKFVKTAILVAITISIFFTVSRGSIILWTVFLCVYIYRNFYSNATQLSKFKLFFILLIAVYGMYHFGVFDPVIERQNILIEESNEDTGRGNMIKKAYSIFLDSNMFGVGLGETNVEKSLLNIINKSYPIGVHNFYLNILAETGIIGLIIIISLLYNILKNLDYSKDLSWMSVLILIITFSSEPVFIYAEFAMPVFFMFMIAIRKDL